MVADKKAFYPTRFLYVPHTHTHPFTQPAMKLKKNKPSSLNHLMDSTFIFTLKWWLTDKQINTDTEWTPPKKTRKHRATRLNHHFLFFDPLVTPLAKNKTKCWRWAKFKETEGLMTVTMEIPSPFLLQEKRALHPKKKKKKKKSCCPCGLPWFKKKKNQTYYLKLFRGLV